MAGPNGSGLPASLVTEEASNRWVSRWIMSTNVARLAGDSAR